MPTIFLAGDSTCAAKAPAARPETGWGEFLAGHLAEGWRVDNRALNGRSTKSFIDQGHWTALLADLKPGDVVLIQFGHNDQKIDVPERYADPENAYPANLRRMAGDVLAAGGRPVLLTSIRRRSFDGGGYLVDGLAAWAEAARATAAELGLPLLDLHAASREWLESLGAAASRRYFLHLAPGESPNYPDGKADDTHLNQAGARAVAGLVARAMAEWPELAGVLRTQAGPL